MTANELTPFIIFVTLALAVVTAAVGAYVLSSQRRGEAARRFASWLAAGAWTFIALIATLVFAVPVLDDVRIPGAPFRQMLLGTIVAGAVCFSLWFVAVRRTMCALRKPKSR